MSEKSPQVDGYFRKPRRRKDVMLRLRALLLDTPLTEALKWRQPCYTFGGKNVAILGEYKEFCALSFFKGALLKDKEGILVAPGENTRSGRLIKFTEVAEVDALEKTIRVYVMEAIALEKSGAEVDFEKGREMPLPEEFQSALAADPKLKTAFEALTPGRRREYLLHFTGAKQSKTRASRVERCAPRILAGKGFRDPPPRR